jgi:hypothetical protein
MVIDEELDLDPGLELEFGLGLMIHYVTIQGI